MNTRRIFKVMSPTERIVFIVWLIMFVIFTYQIITFNLSSALVIGPCLTIVTGLLVFSLLRPRGQGL